MKNLLAPILASICLVTVPVSAATYPVPYVVQPGTPGQILGLSAGYGGTNLDGTPSYAGYGTTVHSVNVVINTAGNYDFVSRGIKRTSAPGTRNLHWETHIDGGDVVDTSGAVVASLSSTNLATRYGFNDFGSKAEVNLVALQPGTYTVNITTTCTYLCTYFQNGFNFAVNPSDVDLTPRLTLTDLPAGTVGVPYSVALPISNPTGYWMQLSVSGLPAGLAVTSPTWGKYAIAGTPTTFGAADVTITTTDSVTKLTATTILPLLIDTPTN